MTDSALETPSKQQISKQLRNVLLSIGYLSINVLAKLLHSKSEIFISFV